MAKKDQSEKPEKTDREKPKIIVDDDWKSQAAAEKEKLAEQIEGQQQAEAGQAPPAGGPQAGKADGAAEAEGPRQLPQASLGALVNQIAMQAMLALGGYEDDKTKRRIVDLELAKFHIDTLKVLEEKTSGNRTDDESKLLDKALYETRMQYVQFAQRVSGGQT